MKLNDLAQLCPPFDLAPPPTPPPVGTNAYRVAAAAAFAAGSQAGEVYRAGATAGHVFRAGSQAGKVSQ